MAGPLPPGPGVVYDVTRLVKRAGARAPTGIDRVDLRYAMRAAEGEWGPAMLGMQLGGQLVEVPRSAGRRLLAHLSSRWLDGVREGGDIGALLCDAGLADPAQAERVLAGAQAVHGFALQNQRAFHMNASHHGIDQREMLAGLHLRLGGGCVFFVHDLIPIEFPEYVRPGDKANHEARMATVLSLGSHVIVNSEATRRALEHRAERLGTARPRCHVAHIGLEPCFTSAEPPGPAPVEDPYFVCVGTNEPRKNHVTLLHLWREMARSLPADRVPKLVLIGRRGWECDHVFAMLDRCDLLRPHVIELSNLGDAEMRRWVQGARAALFPTFAEGWGMPVVEALALGVPVIGSRIPVFEEATQGFAELVDPLDAPAWRARILALASEPDEARAARREGLRGFKPPCWEAHFAGLRTALLAGRPDEGQAGFRARMRHQPLFADPPSEAGTLGPDPAFENDAEAVLAGDMRRDHRDWIAAARAYRRALELPPDQGAIWIQFGHMAKEAGFLQDAYGAYREALRLMPEDADLHLQLGHLFKLGERLSQALAYYEAALALDPACDDARRHAEWTRAEILPAVAA